MTDKDDDALSWAGDESGPSAAKKRVVTLPTPGEAKAPVPGMLLVTYGVLAGIFLIYTIGWILAVTTPGYTAPDLLNGIMWQLGEILALASPSLWFVTVLLLTRGRKPLARLLLLLLGLLLVIPWPFVLGGVA